MQNLLLRRMKMRFDLRSCDSAYEFVLNVMDMSSDEYVTELLINSRNDFEIFWKRNIEQIKNVDFSDLQIMAFHVVGTLDECKEIRKNGLMNLQEVLKRDTVLSRMLNKCGIVFDIENRILNCNGKCYNIDYDRYHNKHFFNEIDKRLDSIAHRVYYDFCVNGFLLNDNISNYGTNIHERPEFLMTLIELSDEVRKLDEYWRKHSRGYIVNFYVTLDQISRFNFDLDEWRDPPYDGWDGLDDDMKIKKWTLFHAMDRANDDLDMQFLYVKDDVVIPPNQIESITEM